jgi:hypothetical protein
MYFFVEQHHAERSVKFLQVWESSSYGVKKLVIEHPRATPGIERELPVGILTWRDAVPCDVRRIKPWQRLDVGRKLRQVSFMQWEHGGPLTSKFVPSRGELLEGCESMHCSCTYTRCKLYI